MSKSKVATALEICSNPTDVITVRLEARPAKLICIVVLGSMSGLGLEI